MRISIDARFWGVENTGLGRYTNNVLSSFFSENDPNEYVVFVRRQYSNIKFLGNVTVVPVDVPHYTLAEQIIIPYLTIKYRADLLYTFHFNAPLLSPIPMVVTIHDLIKSHFNDISTSTHGKFVFMIKRLGYRLVMKMVVARAKTIIVPTQAVKNDILLAYPSTDATKIVSIHEAVDQVFSSTKSQVKSKKKSNESKLLFVGNAYPHKNLRGLLSAFTILRAQDNYTLTILSKKSHFLESCLSELSPKIRKYVTIKQVVSDKELQKEYISSSVLVTPSFMEGFGLPGLEALSLKTRVVASDIPVYKEVYGNHVTYCNPFDAHSIAQAIKVSLNTEPQAYVYPRSWNNVVADIRKVML